MTHMFSKLNVETSMLNKESNKYIKMLTNTEFGNALFYWQLVAIPKCSIGKNKLKDSCGCGSLLVFSDYTLGNSIDEVGNKSYPKPFAPLRRININNKSILVCASRSYICAENESF